MAHELITTSLERAIRDAALAATKLYRLDHAHPFVQMWHVPLSEHGFHFKRLSVLARKELYRKERLRRAEQAKNNLSSKRFKFDWANLAHQVRLWQEIEIILKTQYEAEYERQVLQAEK